VSGATDGTFSGQTSSGGTDAFTSKLPQDKSTDGEEDAPLLPPPPLITIIYIDIKPGGNPDCVNPKARGVIPVAILTSGIFNAAEVNPLSVTLSGAAVKKSAMEDVDGDGDLDLALKIENNLILEDGQDTVTLTGETTDGELVEGTSAICIVPR